MGRGTRYKHVEKILKEHTEAGYTVLEIGCGGAVYKDLFGKYIGINLPGNPYEEHGDVNVYCDGQVLPFKNGAFDMIFMQACLCLIPDIQAVLNESKRVLKDYGKILIFDYNLKTTKRLKKIINGGNNQVHMWTPWGLRRKVRKSGFQADIVYLYWEDDILKRIPKWIRSFLRFRLLVYVWFLIAQLREGWNIVIGVKTASDAR